jgi:RNA recognition motif-containing protein
MNDATAQRKIFIGGLSYGTDDEKLRKYFSTYGPVQDAVVMKDPISRRSRGFGFITFCDLDSVDNALAHEPHTIDARKVEAKRAVPRSSDTSRELPSPPPLPTPPTTTSTTKTFSKHSTTTSSISTPVDAIPINGSIQVSANGSNSPNNKSNSISSQNNISQAQIQLESRQAQDPRINMEEYAFNKVFVGGLHYDTRDGK